MWLSPFLWKNKSDEKFSFSKNANTLWEFTPHRVTMDNSRPIINHFIITLHVELVACATPEDCEAACGNKAGCSNIAYPLLVVKLMPNGARGKMCIVYISPCILHKLILRPYRETFVLTGLNLSDFNL